MTPRCIILGGGGHARALIDVIEARGGISIHGILESNRSLWGRPLLGVAVLGGDELLASLAREGVEHFLVGVGSTRRNERRRQLFDAAVAAGLRPLTVTHPSAVCSPRASLGAGVVVLAGAIVNTGAALGDNAIVNCGAIVEHDCRVRRHVHVASGSCLARGVPMGDDAFVGAGAPLRQQVVIRTGAPLVAA